LKQFSKTIVGLIILVAPRAGAWIETYSIHQPQNQDEASPPVRGRGLKPSASAERNVRHIVAPRAGAWIETKVLPHYLI